MSEGDQVTQIINVTLNSGDIELLDRMENKIMTDVLTSEGAVRPTPGRIVWYQTDGRNGLDYYLPAMITVTRDSHPGDYPDGTPNSLAVPSSEMHVHLTVQTPGGFGSTYTTEKDGNQWEWDYEHEYKERMGKPSGFVPGSGTYTEHDVPFDPDGGRRSWRWPDRE